LSKKFVAALHQFCTLTDSQILYIRAALQYFRSARMTSSIPITVAYGDGIGPEIMEAVLYVLKESGALLTIETVELGQRIYNQGAQDGILPSAWETLRRTKVLLKAPTLTPQGEDYISVSEAIRGRFALPSATLSPLRSYAPFVKTDPAALAGAESIGEEFALFETSHDNVSSLLNAAMLMLEHIGQAQAAQNIRNAWLRTIEDGIHTPDLYREGVSKEKAEPIEFAQAVAARLGQKPVTLAIATTY
jgi:isocitrate/isopropylmalate dehydrogenase